MVTSPRPKTGRLLFWKAPWGCGRETQVGYGMTQSTELSGALRVLDEKLEQLDNMTEVNGFLVRALRDHEQELMRMTPEETRAMLRVEARAIYRPDGTKPNAKALAMLEATLGSGQSAEIIPFPSRS